MSHSTREYSTGELTFRLYLPTGMVRAVRFGEHEILRGIYPAVRDSKWDTLTPQAEAPIFDVSDSLIRIELRAAVNSGPVELDWQADIEASATGQLRYRWRARVGRNFLTNRTGLCVLHAAENAGTPCTVEHVGGESVPTWFPQTISPHQPFREVRAITHVLDGQIDVSVRMEGEVFETEDQRNWTDASFKTYCRPLDWPRPYELSAGSTIEHVITVTVHRRLARGASISSTSPVAPRARLSAAPIAVRLPRLGFTLPDSIPPALRDRVRVLRPAHVRVATSTATLAETLSWAQAEAEFLGCGLDLAIRDATARPPDRGALSSDLHVHLFNAEGNCVSSQITAAWRRAGFASIGTGSLQHFTELNRQRPAASGEHNFTTFGINAQVHAFDDASLLETLSQHGVVAGHAHTLGGGRPVIVAPIVLGPATESADARLYTNFGARWVLGSIVRLAAAGCVDRATFLQPHGPGGFLREDAPTPLEHLFRQFANCTEAHLLPVEPGQRVGVDALLITSDGHRRLLVAHSDAATLELEIPFSGSAGLLGETPASFSAGYAQLPPHSVWQLDLTA